MGYIIQQDLIKSIQDVNLQQIISNDESILNNAMLAAEAEAKSYLRQKYNLEAEFQPINDYVPNIVVSAGYRIYMTATPYDDATAYNIGDFALLNSVVWICTNPTTGNFNQADWSAFSKVGLRYVAYPVPQFAYENTYNVNDQVFWKNKIYTCKVQTPLLSHDVALQYGKIQNIPLPNPAPDDPKQGEQVWGIGGQYSVNTTLGFNDDAIPEGDTRDAQMVLYLIDVALFHLHSRIAPRNIPELRTDRYKAAVDWFKMCAYGDVTPNLPRLEPLQGNRIRFGGNIKQINSY